MKKKVIIVGAGENGEAVHNILSSDKNYSIQGYLDDNKKNALTIGPISLWKKYSKTHYFFVSMGSNVSRKKFLEELESGGARLINAIHKNACIEPGAKLGTNVMIGAFAYVNTACEIGDGTIFNTGSILEHHSKIGKCCHIAPSVTVAGGVSIEDDVFIGIGSTVRDHIRIKQGGFFGAGSNIVNDTDKDSMYYGNPARLIRDIGKKTPSVKD